MDTTQFIHNFIEMGVTHAVRYPIVVWTTRVVINLFAAYMTNWVSLAEEALLKLWEEVEALKMAEVAMLIKMDVKALKYVEVVAFQEVQMAAL